jgi:hypothetical protein
VLLRLKEDYDGAEPAASSVAATNLIRLAALMPEGGGWQAALLTPSLVCGCCLVYCCRGKDTWHARQLGVWLLSGVLL